MRIRSLVMGIAVAALLSGVGFAEDPAGPPEPTPEHQKLEMWVGSWTGSGEMKDGPFGPGGPMTWTEECSWFGGAGFHVVCKSKGTGPMGPMKGLGVIGYNPEKKVYTHYGVDSSGWAGFSEGSLSGENWTFVSEDTMDGKTYHSRFIMKMESPTRMAFQWEMSEDGTSWTVLMDGATEKK